MTNDSALDVLLGFNGVRLDLGGGYWVKIEARLVDVSRAVPHGIRYSLTLHERDRKRILGYDNAQPDIAGGKKVMEALAIGVMSPERIRERFNAMMKGAYKFEPGEPKIWFSSMESLAEMLSDENRALLRVIADTKPDSISVLAKTTGRKAGELTRILKKMSNCGVVELKRGRNYVRPVAKAVEFRIVIS